MARYIDADALYMDIIHRFDYCDDFLEMLESAPTADVRENVKGEWIDPEREGCTVWDKRAYAQCSICGYKQFFGREKNFCPNCGADMREGN